MAGGNLGDLWFNLSVKSNVRQDLNVIGELLQGLDLKSAQTRKGLEGIFGVFNKEHTKEIAEDFKNIAAQMNIQQEEAVKLSARLRELAKLKADIIERDRQSSEHGAFVAMQNESQQAQALAQRYAELARLKESVIARDREMEAHGAFVSLTNESEQAQALARRYTELAKLKESILARDKELGAHGAFVSLVNESQQAQALAQRERELLQLKEAIIRRNDEMVAAENRLAEATRRTNQARQEAVAHTRQQAEALVRLRVQELEAQRRQIQGLFGQGKNILSTEELAHLRSAFSQITQELNTLRTAMSNLGSYSARDLFSMGRGTSDFSPLISSMRAVVNEKREAVRLEERHRQEVAATAARVRSDLVSAFEQARKSASGVNSTVQDLKNLFLQGGLVYGAQQFANSIIQTGGEIVQQHIALRSIIGDVAKADELFAQTQQLALQSPFKFGELNRDVKQLAAFGVEAQDLYDTTKRLADIASGLGVSFERLGLAYGQVKARSWLDGKELRQFAYAGLPLLKSIAELYNSTAKNGKTDYTEGDIKKMISQREVSFDDVKQVLWGMTDEGGKFYNMQLVLSNTLLGQWNKLIDAWDIMLGKFADGGNIVGGVFTTIIKQVANLVLMLDKLSPALLSFGALYALKKGFGAITSRFGIAGELTAMNKAQATELRRYAVAQQRALVEGKITQKIYEQNIAERAAMLNSTINKRNAIEELALRGKYSLLQLQRLAQEKLISPVLLEQLQIMGLISAKQSELIAKGGFWARTQLAAMQGWQSISGLFTGANLAGIGMAVGTAIWMGYDQYTSKLEQSLENMRKSAEDHFRQLNDYVNTLSPAPSFGDKISGIDNMKELLTQTGYFTDELNEQIEACDNINGEYDLLVAKTKEAAENAKAQGDYAKMATNAMYESQKSGWNAQFAGFAKFSDMMGWSEHGGIFGYINSLFNEDLEKNSNDLNESLMKVSANLDMLSSNARTKLEAMADAFLSPEERAMSLEEKIAILATRNDDAWNKIVAKVAHGDETTMKHLKNIGKSGKGMSKDLKEIADDDIPKIMESWRKDLGLSEREFKEYCQRNPQKFQAMFDSLLSIANISAPKIRAALKRMWYAAADVDLPSYKPSKPKRWKNPLKAGSIEGKVFNKLDNAGKLSGGKGGFYKKEMAELLSNINNGKSSGWHDFGEAVQKMYKEVRDENNQAKKAGEAQPYWHRQQMLEAIANQVGVSLDVGKDKVSGDFGKNKNGRQEDKELEALKNKISLYKTYYTELQKYRKLYGKGAEEVLKGSKDFAPVYGYNLPDLSDYGQSVRTLVGRLPKTTAARKTFAEKAISDISSKDRALEEKNIDDVNSALREKLNLLSEEYDTYKKLYELTGDRNSSMRLAFGGNVQSGTMKEYLANEMKKALPEANKRSGQKYTADEVLAMSEADFKAAYGEKSEKVSEIFYKYRDELKKVQKETIDLMTRLVQENATIDQQIADLDRNHERNVALINGDKNMSPEFKARALTGEDKSYNDKRSSLRFEQFKQSTDWVKVFDDLDRVSNETIDEMIKGIDRFSKQGNLSVEVVKQLREALSKLRKENMERNPFDVLMNTTSQANAIGSFLRDKNNKTDKDGKYTVSEAQGKKMGLEAGKYSKADLEGEQRGKYSDFTKTIGVITQKFKALEAAMEPIATLFDNLGIGGSGLTEVFEAAGNALSAASNMSGAMDTLSQLTGDGTSGLSGMLAGAGPYAAAAAAGISMINSIAAKHDEALQKEIEASKERQKEMENLSKNVQWEIDNILGGVYNFTSDKFKDKFQKVLDKYNRTNVFNKHFEKKPSLQQKNYSKDTADAVKESIANPDSAFAAQRAAFMVQRDELEKQLKAEEDKKKSSSSAIADYKQQIIELNQEIDAFTDEWAKKIYDIDLKSWAKEFTDVIVDAWAKGEDAVDAYKDKVKEMMNSLAKNIIAQSVLEIAFEPVQKTLRDKLQNNEGKLKTTDIVEIGKKLDTALGNSVDNVTGLLDELKKKGWDLSENGSLSVSNSIKGVTEETADLLASYINAIRLDVSVNRANIEQMVEAVKKIPNLTVIAQSQLTQLNTLVSLAQTRNEKLDMMYDWMKATTNGTKKISVA